MGIGVSEPSPPLCSLSSSSLFASSSTRQTHRLESKVMIVTFDKPAEHLASEGESGSLPLAPNVRANKIHMNNL